MKIICITLCLITIACSPYKPPLDDTQMIEGESIIVPPDFNELPKEK